MNKIFAKTRNSPRDNQWQGREDRLYVYLSNCEWPWKTINDPVVSFVSSGNSTKYLWRPPTTLKDRQRLAVSKFDAKSSSLNEDFERPLTTMKDCQRPWKTTRGWQLLPMTQILQWLWKTVNDTQRLVTTIWKPGFKPVITGRWVSLPVAARSNPKITIPINYGHTVCLKFLWGGGGGVVDGEGGSSERCLKWVGGGWGSLRDLS